MIRSEKLCEGNLSTSLLEGLTSSDAAQSDCENPFKLKLSSKMTSTRGPHTKVQVLHLLRWVTHTHTCSETTLRILLWSASYVHKTIPYKLPGKIS